MSERLMRAFMCSLCVYVPSSIPVVAGGCATCRLSTRCRRAGAPFRGTAVGERERDNVIDITTGIKFD